MEIAVPVEQPALERCHGRLARFRDRAVEQRYRAWRIDRAIPFARVAMYASVMGWLGAGVAAVLIGPEFSGLVLPAAAFFVVPLVGAVLATTYLPALRAYLLGASAVTNLLGGLVATLIVHRAGLDLDGSGYADVGTTTVVLFVYYACTIIRLPPLLATAAVLPYVALQQVYLVTGFAGDAPRRIVLTALLWIAVVSGVWLSAALERVWRETFRQEELIAAQGRVIEAERERADALLHSILPAPVAERLKTRPGTVAQAYDEATVLFADLVDFTPTAATLPADAVVRLLNEVFSLFDELAAACGVEKIKTIGDAWMGVAGVPEPRPDHAEACADLALAMRSGLRDLEGRLGRPVGLRIGLHTGPVVAGVIGTSRFAYDLWGDTVNHAARLESHGLPGAIQVSDTLAAALGERGYALRERGVVELKGKGPERVFLLEAAPDARDGR